MKIQVTYGAFCALASAALNLALFFSGLQTTRLALGQYGQWAGILIFVVILLLGMREVRASKPNGEITYGGAFVSALMISVFAGLFNAVYTFIHFSFVNPDFAQYVGELTRSQLEAKGMPSSNIDAAIKIQAVMVKPWVQSILAAVMTPITGMICGLLLAIFVKRPPQPHPEEPKAV